MGDFIDLVKNEESYTPLTRVHIPRDRLGAGQQLLNDYFVENAKYPPYSLRWRFRMVKELFMRIANDITSFSPVGDEPVPRHFIELEEYLRRPTTDNIQRFYQKHAHLRGFPGMLGSIDCMHWPWKRCPKAWQGQFTRGDKGVPTIMLEVVASYNLWIWHAFFGMAGLNNDINILNQSHLFREIIEDTTPDTSFMVNGTDYQKRYYLADGIYLEWATFVKAFYAHKTQKNKIQEVSRSARKDVE
uniref:uncharacterized protein LOC122583568 n=1 Tax=Erigeron canadensis TaxID=72917 RepID=UPI001CB9421A|nr:uncharacterized protein LOC122583568 [Erigeron canadensis]